jgi:diacylglycerol kinase
MEKWNTKQEVAAWKKIEKGNRFGNAFRGLYIFYKTTKNLRIHIFFGILALMLSFYLKISSLEWVTIIFTISLVLITEALNTAIEIDINLTSPEWHPFARDTKDVAAGAVLLTSIMAVIVGLIIFLPKILAMVQ